MRSDMRIFVHKTSMADNIKQSKLNKIETITAQTKNVQSSI